MDRKGVMTQYTTRKLPFGRIALLLAALVLAVAVGFSLSRDKQAPAEAGAASAGMGQGAPSIETLERNARANPKDAAAWGSLGLAYYNDGRFEDAVKAYEKASRIDPQQSTIWSALGEARVMASKHDPMPAKAAAAFKRAVALDPADPRARYFLAVKKDLDGDHEGAVRDWLKLLEDTPVGAPWREDLIRTIKQVGKINGIDVADRVARAEKKSPAGSTIPGPSAQDLAAASRIPPSQQRQMAEGMVARLESRLKDNPRNVDGWVMLMRSRMMLGEPDKASQALKDAVAANPAQAETLRQQAGTLGVR